MDNYFHIYRKGSQPFQSISALADEQVLTLMKELYVEGSLFWERFKDPTGYLQARRRTENWLRSEFIAKGGRPKEPYPIYMIWGWTKWLETGADAASLATTEIIQVPLCLFQEDEVSFTYPDSMISTWLASQKDPQLYLPEYHGKVFTLPEMRSIIEANGLPGEGWGDNLPGDTPNYIEAQVWNHSPLRQLLKVE